MLGRSRTERVPVDPNAVLHVIEVIVQDDPLSQAIDALEARQPDWRAHKHSDAILHIDGHARNTFLLAAEALDAIPDTARMAAVFATGTTAGWTIAIRCGGTLIHVEKMPQGGFTWQQYRLGNLVTPTRISREPDLATAPHPQRSSRPALPGRYRSLDGGRIRPVRLAIPMPSQRAIHLTATGDTVNRELQHLAELIQAKNEADLAIARLPGQEQALSGNIGEFVAARVSGIDLLTSGSMRVQRRLPGLTGPSGQARVRTGTRTAAHRLIRGLADAKWLSQGAREAGEGQDEDRCQEPAEHGRGVEPPFHQRAVAGAGVGIPG